MSDTLARILARKAEEVAALRDRTAELDAAAKAGPPPRGFRDALANRAAQGIAVIAEIKRASPSQGVIREAFDPAAHAADYARAGAACLSVLTDRDFFEGDPEHLRAARAGCELPVLRKDFVIDPVQVTEARALGADAILLIAGALDPQDLRRLSAAAAAFGMDVLVEVHDAEELDRVLQSDLPRPLLLGINNRNLRTFETSLQTTLDLLPQVPEDCEVVAESGIATAGDVTRLREAGVRRLLVGESLMRAPSPGAALEALLA